MAGKNTPPPPPPRWMDHLLEWFCAEEFLEIVQGDLHEIYYRNIEEKGLTKSRLRYFMDVADLFRPFALGFSLPHLHHLTSTGMYRNYFITALRNFKRQFGFAFINMSGLAIGMAAFMIILTYVSFELSYDDYHTNQNQLYRWKMVVYDADGNLVMNSAKASPPLASVIKNHIPEVQEVSRLVHCPENSNYMTVSYIDEEDNIISFNEDQAFYADASLLNMFDFALLSGDTTSLQKPYTVVLSASTAERYFGKISEDILGKTLHIPYLGEENAQYEIAGIFQDLPANSHLQADMLMSYSTLTEHDPQTYEDYWHHMRTYVYSQTYPHVTEEQFLQKGSLYDKLVNEKYQTEYWAPDKLLIDCEIQRVDDIYLKSENTDEIIPTGNAQFVYLLSIVGLLVVIIAVVNYVNLTTAKAVQRAKEIGVRKVAGASRGQLILQFFSETFLLNILAILISLLIIWISLPYFRQLMGKPLYFQIWSGGLPDTSLFFLILVLLFLFCTLLSGFYPAMVLSSFRPLKTLKGRLLISTTKGVSLRSALVVVQFAISALLIAGTYLIYQQIKYMQSQSPGFDTEQMLIIRSPTDSTMKSQVLEVFKDDLLNQAFVKQATASSVVPGHQISWKTGAGLTKEERIIISMISVDHDFMSAYNFTLLRGRNFSEDHTTDKDAVIINETYAKEMGFENAEEALHQELWTWTGEKEVIGIVKDYHQSSLKEAYHPICFILEGANEDLDRAYVSVKINTENLEQNMALIQEKYQSYFSGFPYEYFFLDEQFNRQYTTDMQFGKIFSIFAGLAIFIACLGILGLSSYIAVQKSKEIGIRKAMGATVMHIVLLLSTKFVRLVVVSTLIALPMAYFIFDQWLENYAFRIGIGWWFFILPLVVVLLIAILTISTQTIKAALANPVDTLKYE